jgi:hypothetical protein
MIAIATLFASIHPPVGGRGCTARCPFRLWPQTIGGHIFRHKSLEAIGRDLDEAKAMGQRRVEATASLRISR